MSDYLRIAVTYLDPRFHGRGDGANPEWPPSPLRLMQAIVAANADNICAGSDLDQALAWLESQRPPIIVAPRGTEAEPYCLSVPNNAMDVVGKAWERGKYFSEGDANPATHRTMKTVHPVYMTDDDTVHYLWELDKSSRETTVATESLFKAAGRIVALGWGTDLVVGRAELITSAQLRALSGECWLPSASTNVTTLRVPVPGTLDALRSRHAAFLQRIGNSGLSPVDPLTRFDITGYRRPNDPITRPCAVFELRHDNGSLCRYSQRKLMHIAGMIRHLANEVMQQSAPSDVDAQWVEQYVAGHCDAHAKEHRQFSYLPLPSIGHEHADQAVRRVMIAAPLGDDRWLRDLADRLTGRQLQPEKGSEFGDLEPPTLIRVHRDKVAWCYIAPANRWASVTPVILPGHDDHKPAKTRKLIDAALAQSGIDQPCTYEWGLLSRFRQSLSAHKYDRNGRPVYLKPGYLQNLTSVHLTLAFDDELEVSGPLVIGAGRHCGFGLMASRSVL